MASNEITQGTQYLAFEEAASASGRTSVVTVRAVRSGAVLGELRWFGRWRQYTLFPAEDTVWNADCLWAIEEKLRSLNSLQRIRNKPSPEPTR